MNRTIKFINSLNDVLAEDWNRLNDENNPFLRYEFLLALETTKAVCPETGWQPNHLLVNQGKELIAAMPLYLKYHSMGEYVFDQTWANAYFQSGLKYYPKWLNAIPFTPCSGQRILINPQFDVAEIISLCLEHIKKKSLQQQISSFHCLFASTEQKQLMESKLMIRSDIQFQWFNHAYRDFNDFLQSFTSRQRKKIKKERRKIEEQGITFVPMLGNEVSERQWNIFFDFYQSTYLKRGQTGYLSAIFFKQLSEVMPDQLRLVFAMKNNQYLGAALSFVGKDTLYGRYWGCHEEYSGLHFETCYYQGIEFCIERQLNRFDSGAQGEHKISRGFQPVKTYSAHWIKDERFAGLIAEFISREEQYLQEYQQACCEFLPFKQS